MRRVTSPLGILFLAVLFGTSLAVAQPPERRGRPLPRPVPQTPEVRQSGLNENPAPPNQPSRQEWSPFDFNPAGDYSGEYPEPELYLPEPLCDPPYVVPTTGLSPATPGASAPSLQD